MPNNFQHVGLIHLILPEAKIIDARRHPLGSCFSVFKQHFDQGQSFTYDLTDLGRDYRDYVDLMAHFDRVLPGRIRRVIYEDLVGTVSSEQVRRPIFREGLEQWRRYRPWLGPLEDGLGDVIDAGEAILSNP